MWKALSRSVSEVVERRIGCTVFRSDVACGKRHDSSKHEKSKCNRQLSCFLPQLKTYCPLKHLRVANTSRAKQTSHDETGRRQQKENQNDAGWNHPPISACLGAMGWSTVLVLGWYLSHPLGRRIFGDAHFREVHIRSTHNLLVGRIVHAQSPIQPHEVHALNHTSSVDDASISNSFNSSFTSSSGDTDDVFTHQRGPFTPEEALDEVSKEFEAASRAFSGDVENKIGMVCMSKGQHSEAMKHFRRASRLEHAVAAYNLGQCYELGLGTAQNLTKAAKWYKIGSDRGHPTAMYNLAIFLANGWGGLCVDQNKAQELLKLASNLGLREARDALNIIEREHIAYHSELSTKEPNKSKDATDEFLEMIGANVENSSERREVSKRRIKPANLSHLDWLDLSSSSSSPNSEDILHSKEDPYLYTELLLEKGGPLSTRNSSEIWLQTTKQNGNMLYYVVNRFGQDFRTHSAGESYDESLESGAEDKQSEGSL